MKKISTARLLFIAAILAVCGFSFVAYTRIELLMKSSKLVTRTTEVKLQLEKLISTLKDAEAGHRGYLLTHEPQFLESFHKSLAEYPEHISALRNLLGDNEAQQQILQNAEALAVRRVNYMYFMLEVDKAHSPTAEQILGGKRIMDSLSATVDTLEAAQSNLLQQRNAELARQSVITPVWLLFFTLASLLALVGTFLAIIRQIKARRKTEESEKELQQLFGEAPVTIVVYRGPDFIVKVANKLALGMWGKSEKDVIGKPFELVEAPRRVQVKIGHHHQEQCRLFYFGIDAFGNYPNSQKQYLIGLNLGF